MKYYYFLAAKIILFHFRRGSVHRGPAGGGWCGIGSPRDNMFRRSRDTATSCMPELTFLDHPAEGHWATITNIQPGIERVQACTR